VRYSIFETVYLNFMSSIIQLQANKIAIDQNNYRLFLWLKCMGVALIFFWIRPVAAQSVTPPMGYLYNDQNVARIDITMDPDSLNHMLLQANWYTDHEYPATCIFTRGYTRDTLTPIGFRLRGNTSRGAQKKSFRISFNTFQSGRTFEGVKDLNLIGCHNDPSISRAKVYTLLARSIKSASPRAGHARLYINGAYRGLYINMEHISEEFVQLRYNNSGGNLYKCLWPADLNYINSNPNSYKFTSGGRRAYDLTNNQPADDYSDLERFIRTLNQTTAASIYCQLDTLFNIEEFLRMYAIDVLAGHWDNYYNKNNYYLYNNQRTRRFEYLPYDMDNSFGVDWFNINWTTINPYQFAPNGEPRPLFTQLMANNTTRDIYTFYLRQAAQRAAQADIGVELDSMLARITSAALADNYRTLDYGFSNQTFLQSFTATQPIGHVKFGIKPFLTARINSIQALIPSTFNIAPIVHRPEITPLFAGMTGTVTAQIEDEQPASLQVEARYTHQGQPYTLQMFDDGLHGDEQAGDGLFGAFLPSFSQAGYIDLQVWARDAANQTRLRPCAPIRQSIDSATLLYFWMMDTRIPNDLPLSGMNSTFSATSDTALIEFSSAQTGYPYAVGHPLWRKSSLERRNTPTPFNYRPQAEGGAAYNAGVMRGLQVTQPMRTATRENTVLLRLPAQGFRQLRVQFAVRDEGAADRIRVDYFNPVTGQYQRDGLADTLLSLLPTGVWALKQVDLSNVPMAGQSPLFTLRLRFDGPTMTADQGNRVTFNNLSLEGIPDPSAGTAGPLRGVLRYLNTAQSPMVGVNMWLTRSLSPGIIDTLGSALTQSNGAFDFGMVPSGALTLSASCTLPWGGANATDALMVARHAAGQSPLSGIRLSAADVNASQTVNATDALQIALRYTGNGLSSFAAADWKLPVVPISSAPGDTFASLSLQALCMGDVNGSHTPLPVVPPPSGGPLAERGAVMASADGSVRWPVFLEGVAGRVGAASLDIWLPRGAEVRSVTMACRVPGDTVLWSIEGRRLRVAWYALGGCDPVDSLPWLWLTLFGGDGGPLVLRDASELSDPQARVLTGWRLLAPAVESKNSSSILVYPNPTRDRFTLELPGGAEQLALMDAAGRSVREWKGPIPAYSEYSLEGIPTGIYLLRVWTAGKPLSTRLQVGD
jgi:hypothetical protein